MANGWTPERMRQQSQAIQRWKPWEKSTGPKTPEGKSRAARRGCKGAQRKELREYARLLRELDRELSRSEIASERMLAINPLVQA
jgi:hypothetical protein